MESTTLEPHVSKPVHVRSSEKRILFFCNNLSYYFDDNVNNLGFENYFLKASVAWMKTRLGCYQSSKLNYKQYKLKEMIEFQGVLMHHCSSSL